MAATLKVDTITNASNAGTANLTLDASGNATVGNTLAMGSSFKRNRIINGDMRVDQRNAGASVTAVNVVYTVDRWKSYLTTGVYSAQRVADAPAGFINSLKLTVTTPQASLGASDYYGQLQLVEGFNVSDLAWGTANAKTVAFSFWVKSSLTGTFSYTLQSSNADRSYVQTYTISAANTWQQVTGTIAGPTSGTFTSDNTTSIVVMLGLGNGSTYSTSTIGSWVSANVFSATGQTNFISTNGATIQFTGVQLEVGSIATPYERQIYSDQLAQCQRYFFKDASSYEAIAYYADRLANGMYFFPYTMRVAPTITGGGFSAHTGNAGTFGTGNLCPNSLRLYNAANNWTVGAIVGINSPFSASAEL